MFRLSKNLIKLQTIAMRNCVNSIIAFTLKQYRIQMGYKLEYVAHLVNMSKSAYSKLENGQTKITIEKMLKICKALELNPSSLVNNLG